MSDSPKIRQEHWGSRMGLILAMAGNAVGLGNFLRFPIQAVQNGGGAFIIPYIVSFFFLGIPLLLVEWSTGKYAGTKGEHSSVFILHALSKRSCWKYIGCIGLFSNIVIASYYCYIESWTLSYVYHSLIRTFRGMSELQVSRFFDDYLTIGTTVSGIPCESIICYIICIALNVWILGKNIQSGIERVAKVCMPMLILFGLFLVIKIVSMKAGNDGAIVDGWVGLEFLWTPDFSELSNPKIWLAAAGQIFFTLSLGLGCIQCYASYLRQKDDIALNAMTSGFLNEFTEIIIGGSLLIPLAVGYYGLDRVAELCQIGGFGLGFRVLPYLFEQWGGVLSIISGVCFFGLLFGASITSSMAMASPFVGLMNDKLGFSRRKAALVFGGICLLLGMAPVIFFFQGVFDEFDYWGGTIALVLYATAEIILFSWIIGVDKGWKMIHDNAEIRLPKFYKFVLRYITPTMLILILLASFVKPKNDDWSQLSLKGWSLDDSSIIGILRHQNIGPNDNWFSDVFYAENQGLVSFAEDDPLKVYVGEKSYSFSDKHHLLVQEGSCVSVGTPLYGGKIINTVFYIDMSRILLGLLFIGLCLLVRKIVVKERL